MGIEVVFWSVFYKEDGVFMSEFVWQSIMKMPILESVSFSGDHKSHVLSDEEGNRRFDEMVDDFESGKCMMTVDFPLLKDKSDGESWEIFKEQGGYYVRHPEKRPNRNV